MNKPLQILTLDKGNTMNTKKNAMIKKIVLALALITASTVVSANLVPGIGAQALAGNSVASCVTGFLIPTASCSAGGGSASATLNTGDITVQAAWGGTAGGAVLAVGIIQDTLYFQGASPANGRGTIKMTTATGTLTGSATADEEMWVGGFNNLPTGGMIQGTTTTGYLQDTCYDPGIYSRGSPYGVILCVFSNGHDLSLSWDFPLSSIPSTGLEFRAMLSCNPNTGTCNYQDPFTVTLPAGVTFTSASGQFLTAPVPVPAAVWLFGSGLLGLIGVARRKKTA